jgi:RHS repeat-associated protein
VLIARYGYDVLGRRIVKRVYSSVSGGTVGYLRMVYAGSQVSFETDSAGTIGLRYTWGPGTDNLLAIQDAAGNHYYATTDRLGSVRSLAKRDGTWLLTRRWDPYGTEMARDSSASFTWGNQLRYGWTGREYDAETGLYYLRARYYSPVQRRFLAEDPIASSTSPYAYVNGSPLEATDPSGMMTNYEMRMADPRWDALTEERGPSLMVAGVPYAGNSLWVGGFRTQELNSFDVSLTLTQSELCPPLCDHLDYRKDNFITADKAGPGLTAVALVGTGLLALVPLGIEGLGALSSIAATSPSAGLMLPAAGSAIAKLETYGEKFGISPAVLGNQALAWGTRMTDNLARNAGNVNVIIPRPDGVSGFFRITLDPSESIIISAGIQSVNMVRNGLASGRFTLR